ncbi:MAG: hypothetical protein IPP74_14620 [Alphaproteobacteria bacterium]|nr:hypothetical protein [Alphaproteobacteria bacterium]
MNAKSKALGKVTNTVGSALATPSRLYHGSRANRFNREAGVVKKARSYGNAPSWDGDKPTDAFKYRTAADSIKNKYKDGVK